MLRRGGWTNGRQPSKGRPPNRISSTWRSSCKLSMTLPSSPWHEALTPCAGTRHGVTEKAEALHKMAPRFNRIRDKIQMDIDLNRQKWTNKMMIRALTRKNEKAKLKGPSSRRRQEEKEVHGGKLRGDHHFGFGRRTSRTERSGVARCPPSTECWNCGGTGHFARDCTKTPNRQGGSNRGERDTRGQRGSRTRGQGGRNEDDGRKRDLKCYLCGEEHYLSQCSNQRKNCYKCGPRAGHRNDECPDRPVRSLTGREYHFTQEKGICKLCGKRDCKMADKSGKCEATKKATHVFQTVTLPRLMKGGARAQTAEARQRKSRSSRRNRVSQRTETSPTRTAAREMKERRCRRGQALS